MFTSMNRNPTAGQAGCGTLHPMDLAPSSERAADLVPESLIRH